MRITSTQRPSPSLAISMIALFVALAGTAWASVGANSVNSNKVKNNSLKSVDVKNSNLTGTDVAGNSLTGSDINEGSLGQVPSALTAESAPPSGPAGGGLTGLYPNPLLADNSVNSAQIANDAVGTTEVAPNSLTAADLAPDSAGSSEVAADAVTASELAASSVNASEVGAGTIHEHTNSVVVTGGGVAENGSYTVEQVTASCAASEELVAGAARWLDNNAASLDHEKFIVEISTNVSGDSVTVKGGNDSGDDDTLEAVALCWGT